MNPLDVLVIGGGQAGLSMGYHLSRRGSRLLIGDANPEIGHAWHSRWDSLRLFTPSQYDSLPGMRFPTPHDTYPSKDDVANYLQAYATMFRLPVRLDTVVSSLTRTNGRYVAKAGGDLLEAKSVIVATGPFHIPFVPPFGEQLAEDVVQIQSVDYRNPDGLPPGTVLVVGAANSGCQIALEVSVKRSVELSVGKLNPTFPQRILGRDLWWWGTRIGLTRVTADSRLGKRLAGRDQVIGWGPKELARQGVAIRTRAISASGKSVIFDDGVVSAVDTVIWATGFKQDDAWIDIPEAKDEQGRIVQKRGVTPSAGLYTLGRTWQHTRTSALLGWVGRDAGFLAERIAAKAGDA